MSTLISVGYIAGADNVCIMAINVMYLINTFFTLIINSAMV